MHTKNIISDFTPVRLEERKEKKTKIKIFLNLRDFCQIYT